MSTIQIGSQVFTTLKAARRGLADVYPNQVICECALDPPQSTQTRRFVSIGLGERPAPGPTASMIPTRSGPGSAEFERRTMRFSTRQRVRPGRRADHRGLHGQARRLHERSHFSRTRHGWRAAGWTCAHAERRVSPSTQSPPGSLPAMPSLMTHRCLAYPRETGMRRRPTTIPRAERHDRPATEDGWRAMLIDGRLVRFLKVMLKKPRRKPHFRLIPPCLTRGDRRS